MMPKWVNNLLWLLFVLSWVATVILIVLASLASGDDGYGDAALVMFIVSCFYSDYMKNLPE